MYATAVLHFCTNDILKDSKPYNKIGKEWIFIIWLKISSDTPAYICSIAYNEKIKIITSWNMKCTMWYLNWRINKIFSFIITDCIFIYVIYSTFHVTWIWIISKSAFTLHSIVSSQELDQVSCNYTISQLLCKSVTSIRGDSPYNWKKQYTLYP